MLTLVILVVSAVYSGIVYRSIISYKVINDRTATANANPRLNAYIDSISKLPKNADLQTAIDSSLDLVSRELSFTFSNPTRDYSKANCVGYAAMFTTVFNRLALLHKADWKAEHKVAHLYIMDRNLHNYTERPFFKDHDIVIITDKNTGERIAVDPTAHDYLYINRVRAKH